MNKILATTLLTLGLCTGTAAFAAETKPPAAAPAAAATFAGEFAGEWLGENGVGGVLKLAFKKGADSVWTMEASFTFEGATIPTTTKSLKIEGKKLEAVFAWDVQGTSASSKLVGELKGDRLEGVYESTTAEGAGKGKWQVTRKPAGA